MTRITEFNSGGKMNRRLVRSVNQPARNAWYHDQWFDRLDRFLERRRTAIRAASRRFARTHPPYSLVGR